MHPRIGKRSKYNATEKKPESKVVEFVRLNTKKSITLKQEYLYLEDVKTALNIHHLEQNIRLKRWMLKQLATGSPAARIISVLENSIEQDRHMLQKNYKIGL